MSESFPVRGSMLAIGCVTAALVLAALVPDKGEVVRLTTQDAQGRSRATDLWIVDLDAEMYFRAGSPQADWLARLQSGATAVLERSGRTYEIETFVEEDPQIHARLERAMARKYGMADRVWGLVRSSNPVVVRIRRLGAGDSVAHSGPDGDGDVRADPP